MRLRAQLLMATAGRRSLLMADGRSPVTALRLHTRRAAYSSIAAYPLYNLKSF